MKRFVLVLILPWVIIEVLMKETKRNWKNSKYGFTVKQEIEKWKEYWKASE